MALLIWLPLLGNLQNLGLSPNVLTSTAYSNNDNGKIGKCIKCSTSAVLDTQIPSSVWDFTAKSISFGAWVKINLNELAEVTATSTYSGNYTRAGGTILGNLSYGGLGIRWRTNDLTTNTTPTILHVYTYLRNKSGNTRSTAVTEIPFNTWVHIFTILDRENNLLSFYKDGELISSVYGDMSVFAPEDNMRQGNFLINQNSWDGGNGNAKLAPWYLNDVRIYDHALSNKEVKEISKGLVLHYKLNGNQIEATENLAVSLTLGGQTTVTNNIVTTSGQNIDTYFAVNLSESIEVGTLYTVLCEAEMPEGINFIFPLGHLNNTSLRWILTNGHNEITFVANDLSYISNTASWGVKRLFLDDNGGNARALGAICKFYNFQLEKKDHSTPFIGYGKSIEFSNKVYDSSGYLRHGTIVGDMLVTNNSPRNKYSIKNISLYPLKTVFDFPESTGITFSCWMNLTTWGHQTSGIWSTSTSSTTRPDDYLSTTFNHRDSHFDIRGTDGTTYRLNCNASDIPINTWKNVVVTHDGANAKLYIDGLVVRTVSVPTSLVGFKSLFLGWSYAGGVDRKCQGSWSDFRIYSTALSDKDILELYNTSAYIYDNGTLASYEFVEDTIIPLIHKNGITKSKEFKEIEENEANMFSLYVETNQLIEI